MNIDTILFDLDGTLINTNELIIASFLHTLDRYDPGRYDRGDIISFVGEPLRETMERIDPQRVDEMVDVYREHNHTHHDRLLQEYDGVYDTVQTLHKQGYGLGIVTTKMRASVGKGLKAARLASFFDVIVTLDDVSRAKPDPEPVNRALELLCASPETAIMIGDSLFDIEAGKNAGTYTAGVAWSIKGADALEAARPDVMLRAMPDLLDALGVKV